MNDLLRTLGLYIKDHKLQFVLAIILAFGTILMGMGLMSTSGYLISRAAQRPLITDLFMVTAAVRFFGISRAVVRYFERLVSHDLTFKLLKQIRSTLYHAIDRQSMHRFMGRRQGDILERLMGDIEKMQNAFLRILSPFITAALISILTFFLLLHFDTKLAWITLGFLLVNAMLIPKMAKNLSVGSGIEETQTQSVMKSFLVDRLQGLQELLWMKKNKHTKMEFKGLQNTLSATQKKHAGLNGLFDGLNVLLSHLAMASVLVLSIPLVLSGGISGVMLAMLCLGVLSSFESVQGLSHAMIQYESTQASSQRIKEMESSSVCLEKTGLLPAHDGSISFENVSFSYRKDHITLQDIHFNIPKGSKTAVVGPTGSGKSTLVNLLLKFWEPHSGRIKLNGNNIGLIEDTSYKSLFSVLAQDAHIFHRSIRENLLMARADANDAELAHVLKTVGLDDLSSRLDSDIGRQGMQLSGGERQLFLLARALLKDSPIIIADEMTAHLDSLTEQRILSLLWENTKNKTLILISHRLVDMHKMDQILVMHEGRIVEKGTHQSLMAQKGFYEAMISY